MANPFVEEQLDLGILYGTNGGPRFKTEINENAAGYEQRVMRWNEPKHRWTLGNKGLTREELDYLHVFFNDRKGSYEGFRFKDWSDFQVKGGLIATISSINLVQKFQLFKVYRYGNGNGAVKRKITKPISSTISIYFDGVEFFDYTVNTATGVVTFDVVPPDGTTITVDFEFDTPVRFEQDNFSARFLAYSQDEQLWELSEMSLVETRIETDPDAYFNIVDEEYKENFNFNFLESEHFNLNRYTSDQAVLYETVGGTGFKTEITEIGSGFERRDRVWDDNRASFNLGGMRLNNQEWTYLRDFFNARRGSAIGFQFFDISYNGGTPFRARFDQDELNVTFVGYDPYDGEKLFDLSGLKIRELTDDTSGRGYNGLMGEVLPRATLWRIDRVDGVSLGFTDHDRDIVLDSIRYLAHAGASAFATSRKSNLSKDNSSLESILDSDAITEADIFGDKYEEAKITIASVDYLNLPATIEDELILLKGEVGQIETDQYTYKAEISGLENFLNSGASVPTSPLCNATFGDDRCKKDLSSISWFLEIDYSPNPNTLFFVVQATMVSTFALNGKVIVTSGENAGYERTIRSTGGEFRSENDGTYGGANKVGAVVVYEAFPFSFNALDTFTIVYGCNKTFSNCTTYNNTENFRGIPTNGNFAPNSDWMLSPKRKNAS